MNNLGLIGKKVGMTREFFPSGISVPVTVIKIEKGRIIDLITKDTINVSVACQRIYYHLLEHYGNTLIETYMKSALIADKVEVTLNNLTRTGVIKELTIYNHSMIIFK